MPSEVFDLDTAREALDRCWSDGASGSHQLAPGRYVQWARWPEGVQVECSSDAFWQDGELSFLQRRILAKLGFTPPGEALPNYWMRVAAGDDLDAAAQALVRCVREVLTVAEDSPMPALMDLGRELLTCFGARGLAYPYVPEFAIEQLTVQHPGTFTTFEVDRKELYLMLGALDELLEPLREPRFAVSYWGHGMNSYAWTVRLERPGLRMVLQCGYGGLFPDTDQEEQLAELFALSRQLDRSVPESVERDVMVVFSPMRGLSAVDLAPDSRDRPRDWFRGEAVADIVTAVNALLAPPVDPEEPWTDLTEAFMHALRQTAGTGCDVVAVETGGYVIYLTVDAHDEPITATIMTTEDLAPGAQLDAHAHASLRRFGWLSTPDLPNPHLDIEGPEQFPAAARAMTDTVRWVWMLDPVKTRAMIWTSVGGDDGGGEWD